MDLSDGPVYEAFRAEVRTFIAAHRHLAPVAGGPRDEKARAWQRLLISQGYTARTIPKAYGGAGEAPDLLKSRILAEEFATARVSPGLGGQGINMLVPTLLAMGTEEQKRQFIAPTLRGEMVWCQGYSEPGAGSDLANLRTAGVLQGDHWVVNGQKIWTSYADKADWIFCLVRTNKEDKYHGISFLLFDMTTPGVTTKPIKLISGYSPFCETFFDNVVVPKHQIVGELNRGWDVAKYLLGHEREMISNMGGGDGGTASLGGGIKDALDDQPILRAQLAMFDVESLAFRAHSERFMDEWKTGKAHPAYSNLMKYIGTELNKQRHELVMAAGGSDALEWDSERSSGGKKPRDWLRTKANSIEGGTSEVMLNVVAKRILEMPGA